MLTLNTPYKDAKFGTLYGDWDETSFTLLFEELMIIKKDENTYSCYGFLEHAAGITNKFMDVEKGHQPWPVKFTLHGTEYQVNTKKGNDWVKETRQPTKYEQLVVAYFNASRDFKSKDTFTCKGKLQLVIVPLLADMWEFRQKNPDKPYPQSIASLIESYPLVALDNCEVNLLNSHLAEIEKASVESTGTKKAYQPAVDKLKKFKEIYAEYNELKPTDVTLFRIRTDLLAWLDEDNPDYDLFLKMAELILK